VAALPSADMYEKSYMHRDVVTHCVFSPKTDFLMTGSRDGHVKFWKKMPEGVEFVKHYHAHLGEGYDMVKISDDESASREASRVGPSARDADVGSCGRQGRSTAWR
jgi:WD40 repeat protein